MRPRYKELGLKLVDLGKDRFHQPKKPHKVKEKRNGRVGSLIKMFLKQTLTLHRNETRDNFSHIL